MGILKARLIIFALILTTFIVIEIFLRRRKDPNANKLRIKRKIANFSLIAVGSALSMIFVGIAPIAASEFSERTGFGLLHLVNFPHYIKGIFALVLLDFVVYLQHRAFHYYNFLWRFHRVHHLDNLLDATTALRFHPVEIILSLLLKSFVIVMFGIPVEVVFLFEIILSSVAIFNHANIQLPQMVEKTLRYILVTPNFHVIHHHPKRSFHGSNFGFNLAIWDYLFKTYKESSDEDFSVFSSGLEEGSDNSLKGMLMAPFK